MLNFSTHCAFWILFLATSYATTDVTQTFMLLREGAQLSASAVAELENKINKKPNDLENRVRLLSYYAGQQNHSDLDLIRKMRAKHVIWLIGNEPKDALFDVATRIYAIQPVGGPLADPAGFQKAKEAWQNQLSAHPKDIQLKPNAATFLEIHDPTLAESILKSIGEDRWG